MYVRILQNNKINTQHSNIEILSTVTYVTEYLHEFEYVPPAVAGITERLRLRREPSWSSGCTYEPKKSRLKTWASFIVNFPTKDGNELKAREHVQLLTEQLASLKCAQRDPSRITSRKLTSGTEITFFMLRGELTWILYLFKLRNISAILKESCHYSAAGCVLCWLL